MTPHDLYLEAAKRGLRLEPAGDKLAVYPKGACPPDFADVLRQHKAELLDWLCRRPSPGWQSVPPDDLPLNPQMMQPTPENRERVIAFVRRQTGDRPGRLAAWLVLRESTYYEGPGRTWDCALHAYAAARDAVSWQSNRTEQQLWDLLEGMDEAVQQPCRDPAKAKNEPGR